METPVDRIAKLTKRSVGSLRQKGTGARYHQRYHAKKKAHGQEAVFFFASRAVTAFLGFCYDVFLESFLARASACPQVSQMTAAAKWMPARKFLAVFHSGSQWLGTA